MVHPDPLRYAEHQLAHDRVATQRYPQLLPRKLLRMMASPHGYLRGSAPLFYQLLRDHPELGQGPDGEGWIVGDAHLENFGAFRAERRGAESVVFDLNDFDDALIAPFRWDVIRLLTSLILGGRAMGSTGPESLRWCSALLESYAPALAEGQVPETPPPPIRRLLDKVDRRTHRDLLDHRTERVGSGRRFTRGERYQDLEPTLLSKAMLAFTGYVEQIDPERAQNRDHFIVEDLAFRIAGTGSLGALRIAVLTRGKGDLDSRWVFDMKEQGSPSAQLLIGAPEGLPAERVLNGTLACLEQPPRMAGTTQLDDLSLLVRRLLPQEDKLDLTRVPRDELAGMAGYLGARLGAAHRRGATSATRQWTEVELRALLEQAIVLTGIHEAAYLGLCKSMSS